MSMRQYDFSELLTTERAAEIIGVNPATLSRWRASNEGPIAHDFGRRGFRYLPNEVESYAKERRRRLGQGRISRDGSTVCPIGAIHPDHADDPQEGPIYLVLPFPPSVNNLYINTDRGRVLSPRGRDYKAKTARILASRAAAPLVGPILVELKFYPPDNRRRDLDNLIKAVFDSLTRGGVWVDDSQVVEMHAHLFGKQNRSSARVELMAKTRRGEKRDREA